jgi:hypothetical protein
MFRHNQPIFALLIVGCLGLAWAAHPLLSPPQGLAPSSWTYAMLVKDRYPVHLVDPAWVAEETSWSIAETMARLGLVTISVGSVLVFLAFRRDGGPAT